MSRLLSILLLLAATSAQASVQTSRADTSAMIHPVSMTESRPADVNLKPGCKPVLLFMRFPDGRIMLVGIVHAKAAC